METLEYKYVDKKDWPRGPWNNEPDKIQFEDPETKLPCLIVRNGAGALCGYVGVSRGHPFFEIGYSDCSLKTAQKRGRIKEDELTIGNLKMPESFLKRRREQLVCDKDGWCEHTPESMVEVHGGLTFSGHCQEKEDNHGICHVPGQGEPDDVWWLGFDCSHAGDVCPAYDKLFLNRESSYKNVDYVKGEIAQLAKQLKARNPQPERS